MLPWLKQHFPRANRWVSNIANWATVAGLLFLGVSVFMTWAANSITNISQYGWGAVLFAGLGAACVLSLVVSIGLVGWRYFYPIAVTTNGSPNLPNALSGNLSTETPDIIQQIGQLDRKYDALSLQLPELQYEIEKKLAELEARFIKSSEEMRRSLESAKGQGQTNYTILATSLRARDAQAILVEGDKVVTDLGPKLIEADIRVYPNAQEWAAGFNLWGHALNRIDKLFAGWQKTYRPCLDVRSNDFENERRKAPGHIVRGDDQNAIRYKRVCIAQSRYLNIRDDISRYFEAKAGDLPD